MTKLIFAGPRGSLGRFPEEHELRQMDRAHNGDVPIELDEFTQEAWRASERLWVLDLHFYEYGFHGTSLALSCSKILDVRILSEKTERRSEHEAALRKAMINGWSVGSLQTGQLPTPGRLEWRDWLRRSRPPVYPFAHDRFVILDDQLWHFGFSACGSSNHLSAASGPWPAEDMGAVSFYENLWEALYHE